MTFIKRTIKPVIFCLLSVALSAFCIYEIIMTIASVVLIASVIKYGGLWGALIRVPLLFTSNICLCTLIGALIVSLGFAIVMLLSFLIGIIGMIVFLPLVLSRRR